MCAGEQVLICPTCQHDADWEGGLDRCPRCDGIRLSKTLGVLRCSVCGWAAETAPDAEAAGGSPAELSPADERLEAEVRAALDRVFGGPGAEPSQ